MGHFIVFGHSAVGFLVFYIIINLAATGKITKYKTQSANPIKIACLKCYFSEIRRT